MSNKCCERIKRKYQDYSYCPYCGKQLKEFAFIPSTMLADKAKEYKLQTMVRYGKVRFTNVEGI